MEAKLPELLKQVFEPELLAQINSDQPMRDMLQRGLVFELPVPKEALKAVCKTIPKLDVDKLDEYINKAVKLGVLGVSHDGLLRVHRYLSSNKSDKISLNKEAAKVLNRLWYEPVEPKTKISEERLLEIHRLAQLGNETEIIVEMTETLATRWKNRSRI
ncbi:MAG: hypothetical protein HC908_18930 [Calothrix sp. SM1_7_51]|nr:hypothetical protein [Calothrix sp. SM1_7_51]